MNFKVGDKVRCKVGQGTVLEKGKIYEVLEIYSLDRKIYLTLDGDGLYYPLRGWAVGRFERVIEPQEIKVGDVWSSGNKTLVVKVVGKTTDGIFSYVVLNGKQKGMVYADTYKMLRDGCYPLLLHREPPKQKKAPKPQQAKAKKEEKWESVYGGEGFFQKGKEIKVIYRGCEGIAKCNKNDKFDLAFGRDLASYRARIKHWQKMEEELLKEGAK